MPSSRKQITEIKGEGMIAGYNWKVSETTTFQVDYIAYVLSDFEFDLRLFISLRQFF